MDRVVEPTADVAGRPDDDRLVAMPYGLTNPYVLGIDPGVSGAWAVVDRDGRRIEVGTMPATPATIVETFQQLAARYPMALAIVERVGPTPQMGRISVWTFAAHVGALKAALAAARIPYDEVAPVTWQRVMGCLATTARPVGRKDKRPLVRRAEQLFGPIRPAQIADALLLAEYGRRRLMAWPEPPPLPRRMGSVGEPTGSEVARRREGQRPRRARCAAHPPGSRRPRRQAP